MFLEEPHRVAGYYGTVRQKMGNKLFNLEHRHSPYYTSSLALYRLESLFRAKSIDSQYKKLKWYLLMLLKRKVNSSSITSLSNKKIDKFCEPIINLLLDHQKSLEVYQEIINMIENSGIMSDVNKDTLKTQVFKERLLNLFNDSDH